MLEHDPMSGEDFAPPSAVPMATPVSPLSEADFQMLRQAVEARRPVRNAARVAHGSAVTILLVGIGTVPFLLLSMTLTSVVTAATLCIVGYLELLGARKMARGLPEAASHLGWNQVVFIGLIVLYCVDCMLEASPGKVITPEVKSQLSQVSGIAEDLESLVSGVTYVIYSTVIVVSVLCQGSLAMYYFTRRHYLEALQKSTPGWVRRVIDEVVA